MAKTLADYMKGEKKEDSPEKSVKVEIEADGMEFNDMRLLHLFEKVFDPGFGPCDDSETRISRTMKRLSCLKQLLAALK